MSARNGLPISNLVPGGIYRGLTGQIRQVIKIQGCWVQWIMLAQGDRPGPATLKVGKRGWSMRHRFAEWSFEELARLAA